MKTSTYLDEKIEPNNDQLLLASCLALTKSPEKLNAKSCIYFIQGFLAAVQAIAPPIINQQTKIPSRSYGFMCRPPPSWAQTPPTRLFPFSVADDESKARVIKIVSTQLSPKIKTAKLLRDTIFKALKAEYPCSKPN